MRRKIILLFFSFWFALMFIGISHADVSYLPPDGWNKYSSEPNDEGGSYISSDKQAIITINISKPIGQILFQTTLVSFRMKLKPIAENKTTFLGVPCYVFDVREPGEEGLTIGREVYYFLKGDQLNVVIYRAYLGPFEKHLAEFEQLLASFSVTER